MSISFITGNMQNQAHQADKTKKNTDVAAILAQVDPKKKPDASHTDVAAVLAMSSQVPLQEGNRDICFA